MKDILLLLTKHQKQSLDLKVRVVIHLSSVNLLCRLAGR